MRNSKSYLAELAKLAACFEALPDKPEETVSSTLDALWNLAAKKIMVIEDAVQSVLPELGAGQLAKLSDLVEKRISGVPLAHLTGRQKFMELELEVSPDALIPRKETELVGYGALKLIQDLAQTTDNILVIDVCTGAGNLALAFAFHEPKAHVFGADLSVEAIALATRNASSLQLSKRVKFAAGDLLEPYRSTDFLGKVDVLTCNPPYISSGKLDSMPTGIIDFEPDMAFNGGPFGIAILSRLLKEAPEFVKKGGWLAFEVGAGQGPGIQRMLHRDQHYGEIKTVADSEGEIRALLAQIY